MIHQIDSKNEWLLLSITFAVKLDLVFVLTLENAFSESFHFKANRNSMDSSKNGTRDFQNSPPFERWACFYVTTSESLKRFQYFNFETNFLENENLFQKTWRTVFLVGTTKIENTSVPFKTALSEANVKTNRIATTKSAYHKE